MIRATNRYRMRPLRRHRLLRELARLYTVIGKRLDEVSFTAGNHAGERMTIDAKHVERALGEVSQNEDLSRYVL